MVGLQKVPIVQARSDGDLNIAMATSPIRRRTGKQIHRDNGLIRKKAEDTTWKDIDCTNGTDEQRILKEHI